MKSPFHTAATYNNVGQVVSGAVGYYAGGDPSLNLTHWFGQLHDVTRDALAWETFELMLGQATGHVAIIDTRHPIDDATAERLAELLAQRDVAGGNHLPPDEPRKEPKRDRVKVADNIFQRGDRYQVIWQADGKQHQHAADTQAEAFAFREELVTAGRVKPLEPPNQE